MADPLRQPTAPPRPSWVRLCQWLWNRQGFLWGTVICGVALNLFASWLVTPMGAAFSHTPLGAVLGHPLLSALGGLGLLGLTGGLWLINRFYPAPAPQQVSTRPLTQQDRQAVIHLLRQEYSKRLAQSLQGAAMMVLGLQERSDAIRSSAQLVFRRTDIVQATPLPPGTTILQAYDNAGHGLLILGAPGSGKTTLLLDLAETLLARAESNPTGPIAVILNLSSWANKKTPLASWLIDQLRLVYGIPSRLGQTLLEQDHWLLLLDGLDEVEASARSACIEAIHRYREEHFVPLVVCSRSHEYLTQKTQLTLSSALEIQPLQEQEVREHLKRLGKPMVAVRTALRTNPVLNQLLTTPLMLSMVLLAYRDKAVKDISKLGSVEDQQREIFAHYVARMLERSTTRSSFTSQQTRRWLTWLAQQMRQQHLTEFYVEELQSTWLPEGRLRRIYEALAVRLPGMLIGALVGLFVFQVFLSFFWAFAPAVSDDVRVEAVLVGGLIGGLFSGRNTSRPRTERKIRSWRTSHRFITEPLISGLLVGLGLGLVSGLISGLSLGLSVFLFTTIFKKVNLKRPQTDIYAEPHQRRQGYPANNGHMRNGLFVGLMICLSLILSDGLLSGLDFSPLMIGTLLFYGLIFGLIGGLLSLLLVGRDTTIQPAEIIVWSWTSFLQSLTNARHIRNAWLVGGLIVLLITLSSLGYVLDSRDVSYLVVQLGGAEGGGLGVGLSYWLLVGLFNGLSSDSFNEHRRIAPNQGTRRSAKNGIFVGLISGFVSMWIWLLCFVLGSWLIDWLTSGQLGGLSGYLVNYWLYWWLYVLLAIGFAGGLLAGLFSGGLACIRHGILRWLLWRSGAMPWSYVRFLQEAHERILLQRVGSGYRFIHPLLQDYFASLGTGTSANTQSHPPSPQF